MDKKEMLGNLTAFHNGKPVGEGVTTLQELALSLAGNAPFLARDLLTAAAESFPQFYGVAVVPTVEKTEKKEGKAKGGLPDVG